MRARALCTPVFFGSSTHLTGCCATPPAYPSFPGPSDEEKTLQKFQFGKKSAKVYHCLYSSIEQLQVAL